MSAPVSFFPAAKRFARAEAERILAERAEYHRENEAHEHVERPDADELAIFDRAEARAINSGAW